MATTPSTTVWRPYNLVDEPEEVPSGKCCICGKTGVYYAGGSHYCHSHRIEAHQAAKKPTVH